MKLDLVLVNPGCHEDVYQGLHSDLMALEPPQWCGLIATFMRNRGFNVQIIDAEAENLHPKETAQKIVDLNPTLAGIIVYGHHPSASTQTMTAAGEMCRYLKDQGKDVPTIMVGGHVSALPQRTLKEESVDYVCEGEGPYTVLALLEYLKSSRNTLPSKVPGLWYRDGEEFKFTQRTPLILDLDKELPQVAWDLLSMEKYRAHNWHCFNTNLERQPYANLYTSLGCPYNCTFCCINAPFGNERRFRMRSSEAVIKEIDILVNQYGVKNIKITDEMFVLNKRHVLGICDAIIERGYDLNIWAYARIDTVKDELLDKLRQAGFLWLALGIESASEHVRDGADKNFGQNEIIETVRKIENAGINIIGNYIFGLPDDTHKTMQETLDLALELNCDFANIYSAMAYPGSPLYDMAVKNNLKLPDTWHGYSQYSVDTYPLRTDHVSSEEVLKFRDDAFHTYFSSPRYLDKMATKFGVNVAKHVSQMAEKRLERAYAK